jgi:hypothetical protein
MMQSRTPSHAILILFFFSRLSLLLAEDVAVTSVQDGHGRAAEELSAGGTKLDLEGAKG